MSGLKQGKRADAPFKVGDKVKTDFYIKDKHLIRTVVDCYMPSDYYCESGWYVDAVDEFGRHLVCDSGWFKLA